MRFSGWQSWQSAALTRLCRVLLAAVFLVAGEPAGAIVGGSAEADPPDSPSERVDPNVATSPWAGVGSLSVLKPGTTTVRGVYTATAIDAWHVITAAHVVAGSKPADIRFNLNYGADLSHTITAEAVFVHPDYAGFVPHPSSGVVHDDVAVVRLSASLPFGVPFYGIVRRLLPVHTTVTLVGYGASGDGINGVTVSGSPTVKRAGRNNLDRAFADNGGSGLIEVYLFDFDGPDASTNRFGGPTLGNRIEATVAGGDSGSPAFVPGPQGSWLLAGVNTFVAPQGPQHSRFGGVGGGVLLYGYAAWIDSIVSTAAERP
jgi:hypothetical protein